MHPPTQLGYRATMHPPTHAPSHPCPTLPCPLLPPLPPQITFSLQNVDIVIQPPMAEVSKALLHHPQVDVV